MTDVRQQIALQLNAYTDIRVLKAAVWEWVSQSDVSLTTLEQILAAHHPEDVSYTELDWQHLQAN